MKISVTTSRVWTMQGTVISGGVNDEANNYQEPTVMLESGTYKMWLKHGWATPQLYYYTSSDGITWTPYGSNPLLSGTACQQPFVFKDGTTYYLYFHAALNAAFQRWSSTDGIAWTQDSASVLALGGAGAWDDYQLGNVFVWKEDTTDWRMIYEARGGDEPWKIGYATSSDGLSWSKSGSNPVITETGSVGGQFIFKAADGTYWMWVQRSASAATPTDIARYKSTNLTTWTRDPAGSYTLSRMGDDEGAVSNDSQLADITMLETGGQVYAWFMANPNGNAATGHAHIKLAIARLPFEQLVHTNEGY